MNRGEAGKRPGGGTSKQIISKARGWTSTRFDEETRREIKYLIEKEDFKELEDRFHKDLEFGTGGMRGIMAPGTNRMNVYTVGRATQGLANHLLESCVDARERGVSIAYDSRRNSSLFAREAAQVLAGNGIRVFLFRELRPTPLLSFAVRELKNCGGIVITASHNPKEYNGYKVYSSTGGQVTAPEDRQIVDSVNRVEIVQGVKKIDYGEGMKQGMIGELDDTVEGEYLARIHDFTRRLEEGIREELSTAAGSGKDLKIVYTPLHGSGITLVPKAVERIPAVALLCEKEQSVPDGNFPTTPSPNPEETTALARAIARATEENADMVIATDPDCDRMGLAVRDMGGAFTPLSGNQIGCLFTHLIAHSYKRSGKMPVNPVVISTIVSTDLTREIARDYGVEVIEVLTGFKYIAEKMHEFDLQGTRTFIFGFEESYGYLADTFVRDKDGVIASVLAVLLLKYAAGTYGSVYALLEALYRKYGLYAEYGRSFTLKGVEGAQRIEALMEELRTRPPEKILGGRVVKIKDYFARKTTFPLERAEEEIAGLPISDVLQFFTEGNVKVSVRPSGTEPKIKFYVSLRRPLSGGIGETRRLLDEEYGRIAEELFQRCGLA